MAIKFNILILHKKREAETSLFNFYKFNVKGQVATCPYMNIFFRNAMQSWP